jgi:hypothetical protein
VNQSLATKQETFSASVAAAEEIVYRVRDVLGIAQKRIGNTREAARRLRRAAMACGNEAAMREAFLIEKCADNENVWVGQYLDLQNEKGATECFDALGTLCACGSRMCESCSADLRRRSRRRAGAGLKCAPPEKFEELRLATLTTPTPQGASQKEAASFSNGCFRRLQKKAFWSSRVRGAIKGVEVPWGKGGLGFHPHIHLIVVGQYIERDAAAEMASAKWRAEKEEKYGAWGLRLVETLPPPGNLQAVWNECLLAEIKSRGWRLITNARKAKRIPALLAAGAVVLDWREVHKAGTGLQVDIRKVKAKGKQDAESISYQDAISEVLKYICKAEDWFNVPDAQLVQSATVKRWPRMFELIGACKPSTKKETSNVESEPSASLDTPCLSAAEKILETGSERENETGEKEIYIVGAGWVAAESAYLVAFMYCEEEWLPLQPPSPAPAPVPVRLPRAKSLRWLGEIMEFGEWCLLVERRWAERRFIRRRLLSQQFEHASFWALDGRRWGMLPGQVEEI